MDSCGSFRLATATARAPGKKPAKTESRRIPMNAKILINWVKLGILGLILLIVGLKSVHSTGTTEVGVRTIKWSLFSKSGIENKVYQPGATYFLLPFFNQFSRFDARLQVMEMTATQNAGDKRGVDDLP